MSDPTLIHWHGLLPPWPMDAGTYWMHAHTLQEQNLLDAPLIVRSAADAKADEQEVVVLLHDFSFTPASELLAHLKSAGAA